MADVFHNPVLEPALMVYLTSCPAFSNTCTTEDLMAAKNELVCRNNIIYMPSKDEDCLVAVVGMVAVYPWTNSATRNYSATRMYIILLLCCINKQTYCVTMTKTWSKLHNHSQTRQFARRKTIFLL